MSAVVQQCLLSYSMALAPHATSYPEKVSARRIEGIPRDRLGSSGEVWQSDEAPGCQRRVNALEIHGFVITS
jgi:hypothetical protein